VLNIIFGHESKEVENYTLRSFIIFSLPDIIKVKQDEMGGHVTLMRRWEMRTGF
jgi:hypothetical protein